MEKKGIARLLCLAAIAILACAHPDTGPRSQPIEARVLNQSADCGRQSESPAALWLGGREELKAVANSMNRGRLKSGLPEWARDLDFSDHGVLLVHMGQKPTGGFSLEFIPGHAYVCGQTATVVLQWITPPADAMVAQMITNPCIWLKLPSGAFSKIKIMDQNNRLKALVNFDGE